MLIFPAFISLFWASLFLFARTEVSYSFQGNISIGFLDVIPLKWFISEKRSRKFHQGTCQGSTKSSAAARQERQTSHFEDQSEARGSPS